MVIYELGARHDDLLIMSQARCLINCERSARHDAIPTSNEPPGTMPGINSRDSPGEKKFRASRAVSPGEIGPHIMKCVY